MAPQENSFIVFRGFCGSSLYICNPNSGQGKLNRHRTKMSNIFKTCSSMPHCNREPEGWVSLGQSNSGPKETIDQDLANQVVSFQASLHHPSQWSVPVGIGLGLTLPNLTSPIIDPAITNSQFQNLSQPVLCSGAPPTPFPRF